MMAWLWRPSLLVAGFAAVLVRGAPPDEGTCRSDGVSCSSPEPDAAADDGASLAQLRLQRVAPHASSLPFPCTYSKTYAFPETVVQEDSKGIEQMESRCAGKGPVNSADEATCILNSNADGYDYDKWPASQVCIYPAGMTPTLNQDECTTLYEKWLNLGLTFVTLPDGTEAATGIGHGVLQGLRGECALLEYQGRSAVIFQVDVRSWSLEITKQTWEWLTKDETPEGHCFVPNVKMIDCTDVPGMK